MDVNDHNWPTKVQMTLSDHENHKQAWKGLGLPTWALRSEQVQEIVGLGDGKCEYRTWEIMVGPGGYGSELKEANERGRKELKRLVEAAT